MATAPSSTKKLDALYFASRAKELDRESAARDVLVRVLVSPNFLFKAETLPPIADAKTTEVPLNAHEFSPHASATSSGPPCPIGSSAKPPMTAAS